MSKKHTKRFAVLRHGVTGTDIVGKFGTIQEVVDWCNAHEYERSIDPYMVECREDDIEIDADELMEAWAEGERPEDLQMF